METAISDPQGSRQMTLARMSTPAKALLTCIIFTLAVGMLGALGQIIIHDIIPTFFTPPTDNEAASHGGGHHETMQPAPGTPAASARGDLFANLAPVEKKAPSALYPDEQFVWTLKWTHIHLFGMSMIFIFMGAITVWLDAGITLRTWLLVLPFVGVLIDILAMWLKAYVSPAFFWLHIPGGGVFAAIFAYVSLRALWEMWFKPMKGR